jgi:Cellulase (glycosyl hydrolase family 5)
MTGDLAGVSREVCPEGYMTTAGLFHRRLPGQLGAVIGSVLLAAGLLAAGAVAGNSPASVASAAPPPAPTAPTTPLQPPCKGAKATGPFTTGSKNGHPVVFQGGVNHGEIFNSYGTTVPGLEVGTWQKSDITSVVIDKDEPKIAATFNDWCGNTVRLQVDQDVLFGTGGKVNSSYLAAIRMEVNYAIEQYGLVVVLNDSTESAPATERAHQTNPTALTKTFWKKMYDEFDTGRYAGDADRVIFDLFNEPRLKAQSYHRTWQLWYEGTAKGQTFDGAHYVGMNTLAQYVRSLGAKNLFWAEAPYVATTFSGMVSYHYLLKVSNVVYALHHPKGLGKYGQVQNTAVWYKDFGYLVNQDVAPVVEGEWTNFMPGTTYGSGECWLDPYQKIPEYLQYLAVHGIGMSAYQLSANLLITQIYKPTAPNLNVFREPTMLGNPLTWDCGLKIEPKLTVADPDRGAGLLIMNWFRQCNPQSGDVSDCTNRVTQTTPAPAPAPAPPPPAPTPAPRPRCPHGCPPGARRHHGRFPGHGSRFSTGCPAARLPDQVALPGARWTWSSGQTGYWVWGCLAPTPTAPAVASWTPTWARSARTRPWGTHPGRPSTWW